MSDLPARKKPVITSSITVEPNAESKNLDKTKSKYTAAKHSARISVGTKPLSESSKSEFAIKEGSSLKKLRISAEPQKSNAPKEVVAKTERALKPDTFTSKSSSNLGLSLIHI